ncbi:hypothetical protein [Ascidiaceihabitans sp.]|uniref:hypothetical protein n=1 Tax=Ascidiaceihabitans sp. TaxID=1872644 RepID=UPI003296DE69
MALITFCIGFWFNPTFLGGDVPQMLITLFGLMSTGILPAISLLVGNTISATFTPAKLDELDAKTSSLIGKLFSVLAMLLVGSGAILVHESGLPTFSNPFGIPWLDVYANDAPDRFVQGIVFACALVATDRLRLVWVTFQSVRELRIEISKADSERIIEERVPSSSALKEMFPTDPDFGLTIDIADNSNPKGSDT